MSRTDVHRPHDVQARDPYSRHRFYRYAMWPLQTPELWSIYNLCGCWMCTGQFARRYRNGQRRTAWRTIQRRLLKTAVVEMDTVDTEPRRRIRESW